MALLSLRNRSNGGLGRLQDEMNDLFNQFFTGWPTESSMGSYWPAVDISEEDENIVVRAELPGVERDDIDISVQGNTLSIRGEKRQRKDEESGNYRHVERRMGSFQRVFTLPTEVDAEKIEAHHRDGILTVTLPKSESAKPKRITVKD